MIGASALLLVLAQGGRIGRAESVLLLALLAAYTVFLIVQSRRLSAAAGTGAPPAPAAGWDRHWAVQVALVVAGLALLVVGADWLVGAAVAAARAFGVSELVIGLTIVAAGTSLPEVAASLAATLKGERDIAVGNVVGSCTFNILGCLGAAGLVAPLGLTVAPAVLAFDGWVMLAVAVATLPVILTGHSVARWEGVLFLFYYAAYVAYLILAAQQHDTLPLFSATMLWFVLPLTAVTLVVSLLPGRPPRR